MIEVVMVGIEGEQILIVSIEQSLPRY